LRTTFGPASGSLETALSHASRVLPMLTTAHQPSASNRGYWVEVPANMPIVEGGAPVPYSDTTLPKRFGTVSPLDPAMFASIEEHAAELLKDQRSGKYSPIEVAQFFEDSVTATARALETAANEAPSRKDAAFRRVEEDIRIQIGLGEFYAAKFRAGLLFEIYRRTGHRKAHEEAVQAYRKARAVWAAMAERARGVYVPDITYGETPVRRGHWIDRLPAIDQDLAALETAHFDIKAELEDQALRAILQATGRPTRPSFKCTHNPPRGFQARQSGSAGACGSPARALGRYAALSPGQPGRTLAVGRDGTRRAVVLKRRSQAPTRNRRSLTVLLRIAPRYRCRPASWIRRGLREPAILCPGARLALHPNSSVIGLPLPSFVT